MVKANEIKIPLCTVADGADLCIENALQFCSDAKVLCDAKSIDHAWALCIFAVEELGKAIWLKSKAAYTHKESKTLVLKKEKPNEIFHSLTLKSLTKKGFRQRGKDELFEVNPFYDHLSKLLIASPTMFMAAHSDVTKSLEDKTFQSVEEIDEAIYEMLKDAYDIEIYRTNQRELALYVDYDQKKDKWIKGRPEVNEKKVRSIIAITESAIRLDSQWKLTTKW